MQGGTHHVLHWILIVVGSLVAIVLVIVIIGLLLPRAHVASRTVRYNQPPEVVFDAITDWRSFPNWRQGLRVSQRAGEGGRTSWVEIAGRNEIPLEVLESSSPTKLVVKVAGQSLPFGGTWTYQIQPTSDGG